MRATCANPSCPKMSEIGCLSGLGQWYGNLVVTIILMRAITVPLLLGALLPCQRPGWSWHIETIDSSCISLTQHILPGWLPVSSIFRNCHPPDCGHRLDISPDTSKGAEIGDKKNVESFHRKPLCHFVSRCFSKQFPAIRELPFQRPGERGSTSRATNWIQMDGFVKGPHGEVQVMRSVLMTEGLGGLYRGPFWDSFWGFGSVERCNEFGWTSLENWMKLDVFMCFQVCWQWATRPSSGVLALWKLGVCWKFEAQRIIISGLVAVLRSWKKTWTQQAQTLIS